MISQIGEKSNSRIFDVFSRISSRFSFSQVKTAFEATTTIVNAVFPVLP